MATAPTSRRLNLTRDQLATFLTDQQQIRQFELLFSTVDQIQVIVGTDFEYQADNAAATANEALAQISRLAQALELLALAPVPNNVNPAQDPYECCNSLISQVAELQKQIEGLQMQPPVPEMVASGVVAPVPLWIDLVSRPSTLVGTSTVSGISGDVRLHAKVGQSNVYRFIPSNSDPLIDSFYSTFAASVLSGLIVSRG
jgi:hypothetical protein